MALSHLLFLLPAALALCLDDGLPENKRRNLTYPGYSGPIVDTDPQWSSGRLVKGILEILFTEILGYHYDARYPIYVTYGMVFGPSGCKDYLAGMSRLVPCEEYDVDHPATHLGSETWGTGALAAAVIPPERRAQKLSNHAYRGTEGMYFRGGAFASAYDSAEKMVLGNYRGWNVTKFPTLPDHFDNVAVAGPKIKALGFDRFTVAQAPAGMEDRYEELTGDVGAHCYDSDTKTLTNVPELECGGDLWISRPCHDNPEACIPVLTFTGAKESIFRQYTAFFDMPLAIMDLSWGGYAAGVKAANVGFLWWQPDAMFNAFDPLEVEFPTWNINEHNLGIYKTSMMATDLTKYVWRGLSAADDGKGANIVHVFDQVMLFQSDHDDFGHKLVVGGIDPDVLSCNFLRDNKDRWASWIPDLSQCGIGEGLDPESAKCVPCPGGTYSTMDSTTVKNRVCQACVSGTYCAPGSILPTPCEVGHFCEAMSAFPVTCSPGFAQPLSGQGSCSPCADGHANALFGAQECQPCAPGYSAKQTETDGEMIGALRCMPCPFNTFASGVSASECTPCDSTFVTKIPASESKDSCICPAGEYFLPASDGPGKCMECDIAGLVCPGGLATPLVQEGYFGSFHPETDTPLRVWKCQHGVLACPGATVTREAAFQQETPEAREFGVCAGALFKNGCTRCPEKYYYSKEDTEQCVECLGGDTALFPLLYLVGLLLMVSMYKITKYKASQKLTNMLMLSCSVSLLLNFFQMLGVIGFYAADFPDLLQGFFEFFQLFVFDLDYLRASCATGSNFHARFLTRTLTPILFMGSFFALYPITAILSKIVPSIEPMDRLNLVNTAGLITNAGYIALCKLSMQFYECKDQPSASPTVVAYPDVDCNSDEHNGMMPIAVIFTLVYGAGIYIMSLYLCYVAPVRMVEQQTFRRQTRFLVGRWNPGRWYWGPVLQTRNLLVSLVAVGYPSDGMMQFLVTGSIIVLYTGAQAVMEPWRDLFLNVTDTCLGVAISLTCMFSVLLVPDVGAQEARVAHAQAYLSTIFIVSFSMLAWAAGRAINALVRPHVMENKDAMYTKDATRVLLLQTQQLFQLCAQGIQDNEIEEALASYLTHSEQKSIFKVGKVLLHELCGVKYKSNVQFRRLMINKEPEKVMDLSDVTVGLVNEAVQVSMPENRVSALSKVGGAQR